MSDSMEKCEHCGTTKMTFDPPLVFDPVQACGEPKPGTYSYTHPGGIPACEKPHGHEGKHAYLVEYLDTWPAVNPPDWREARG